MRSTSGSGGARSGGSSGSGEGRGGKGLDLMLHKLCNCHDAGEDRVRVDIASNATIPPSFTPLVPRLSRGAHPVMSGAGDPDHKA